MQSQKPAVPVLMPQSFGEIRGKPSCHSEHGSIVRIKRAGELIANGTVPSDAFVIFPQRGPQLKNGEYLGQNLARFTRQLEDFRHTDIIDFPFSWGTYRDMMAMYMMIAQLGHDHAHVTFVTDPAHLWRVRLIWWLTHPKEWTASFYACKQHRLPWEIVKHETPRLLLTPVVLASQWIRGLIFGRLTAHDLRRGYYVCNQCGARARSADTKICWHCVFKQQMRRGVVA